MSAKLFLPLMTPTKSKVIRVGANLFSMPMKDDEKQDNCSEKTNVHTVTHEAYQYGNSEQT